MLYYSNKIVENVNKPTITEDQGLPGVRRQKRLQRESGNF
jgi:hypothetical protein